MKHIYRCKCISSSSSKLLSYPFCYCDLEIIKIFCDHNWYRVVLCCLLMEQHHFYICTNLRDCQLAKMHFKHLPTTKEYLVRRTQEDGLTYKCDDLGDFVFHDLRPWDSLRWSFKWRYSTSSRGPATYDTIEGPQLQKCRGGYTDRGYQSGHKLRHNVQTRGIHCIQCGSRKAKCQYHK